MNITFIGGDARMRTVAQLFSEQDTVRSFCLPKGAPSPVDTLFDALHMTDVILLPLPATRDGIHPLCEEEYRDQIPAFAEIFSRAPDETAILGGHLSPAVTKEAERHGLPVFDYYGSERLLLKNAEATAEAALGMAISTLPVVLCGTPVAVIGGGRIARALIPLLRATGAHVYVYARDLAQRHAAEKMGAAAFPIPKDQPLCLAKGLRAVFSTVPARLFDADALSSLDRGVPLFDLGGDAVDREAAALYGIPLPPCGALPGRYSPESAGSFLYDEIQSILRAKRGRFL